MAASFVGQSSIFEATIVGRTVLGIAVEVGLSVDATADLEVDQFTDLAVTKGVIWTGATSVQSIAYEGESAKTLSATNP